MCNHYILVLICFLTACGGGGGGASDGNGGGTNEIQTEKIRFINAIKSEEAVNVQLGDDVFIEEIAYGDASSYVESQEGTGDKAIELRVTSIEKVLPILSADQEIAAGTKATYFLYDEGNVAALKAVTETAKRPFSGECKMRFANMSEEETSLDVYLVLPGEEIAGATAAQKAVAFKDVSDYVDFRAGTFDIVYATAGTTSIVRRVNSVTFEEKKVYTHIIIDNTDGVRGQTSRIFEDTIF